MSLIEKDITTAGPSRVLPALGANSHEKKGSQCVVVKPRPAPNPVSVLPLGSIWLLIWKDTNTGIPRSSAIVPQTPVSPSEKQKAGYVLEANIPRSESLLTSTFLHAAGMGALL